MNLKTVQLERTAYLSDQLILEGASQVAFAGRSNVGKSSLLNKLFNRLNLAQVSKTPGKTQSVNYFKVNGAIYFVDLPGYGYSKRGAEQRDRWKQLMEDYFQKSQALRGLAHLIDIRHEPTELDLVLHEWTLPLIKHHLYVLTKSDKVSRQRRNEAVRQLVTEFKLLESQVVPFSAETGEGKNQILGWVGSVV